MIITGLLVTVTIQDDTTYNNNDQALLWAISLWSIMGRDVGPVGEKVMLLSIISKNTIVSYATVWSCIVCYDTIHSWLYIRTYIYVIAFTVVPLSLCLKQFMFINFVVNYFRYLASPWKYLNTNYFSVQLMKRCTRMHTIHLIITFQGYHFIIIW